MQVINVQDLVPFDIPDTSGVLCYIGIRSERNTPRIHIPKYIIINNYVLDISILVAWIIYDQKWSMHLNDQLSLIIILSMRTKSCIKCEAKSECIEA